MTRNTLLMVLLMTPTLLRAEVSLQVCVARQAADCGDRSRVEHIACDTDLDAFGAARAKARFFKFGAYLNSTLVTQFEGAGCGVSVYQLTFEDPDLSILERPGALGISWH